MLISWLLTLLALPAASGPATQPADRIDERQAELAREVRDKGWIVYSARSEEGDWDLFLCRPDGSDIRNITNTPDASEAAPRFNHDGTKLLYRGLGKDAVINHDKWGFQGRLMIADADGGNPRALGEEKEYPWATWSPDGKRLACMNLHGIEIVDIASGMVERKLDRHGIFQQLFWSPDGRWFVGVANHFGEMWTVVRMNVESAEVNAVNSFQNCTPDWLPDSRRVILSHRPKQEANNGYGWTQLYVADGDGRNLKLVYGEEGKHVYGGATSPDMKYVLFGASTEDGGGSEKEGAPLGLMRMRDAPTIIGESTELRERYPDAGDGPVLLLPAGWEPHWTYTDIFEEDRDE